MIRLDYQPPRPALWRRLLARFDAFCIRAALRDLNHWNAQPLTPAQRDELRRMIDQHFNAGRSAGKDSR